MPEPKAAGGTKCYQQWPVRVCPTGPMIMDFVTVRFSVSCETTTNWYVILICDVPDRIYSTSVVMVLSICHIMFDFALLLVLQLFDPNTARMEDILEKTLRVESFLSITMGQMLLLV